MNDLMKVIKDYQDTPFEWGKSDCCMFVADCVNAQMGVDPAENHRGKYSTEIGAKRALAKYGSIEDVLDKLFTRIDYNLAKRGDVVMYESELGATMGVVWNGGAFTPSEIGLVHQEVEPMIVWRVA